MILLLASGLAATATGFLEQAGMLPAIKLVVWDSNQLLSTQSITGQLAHTLVGYQARPCGIALLAWVTTFLTILSLMKIVHQSTNRSQQGINQPRITEAT